MDFTIPPYSMISAQGEVAERIFTKLQGKGNRTYYIPVNHERAGNVYVDVHDPKSNGFGGSVISFKLEDGSEDKVKGPWHTNTDALFKDTGVDLRNEHRTFVVLAMGVKYNESKTTLTDVVYQDPEGGQVGSFNRYKELEKQYPEALRYYSASRGGSSSGPTEAGDKKFKAERDLK